MILELQLQPIQLMHTAPFFLLQRRVINATGRYFHDRDPLAFMHLVLRTFGDLHMWLHCHCSSKGSPREIVWLFKACCQEPCPGMYTSLVTSRSRAWLQNILSLIPALKV